MIGWPARVHEASRAAAGVPERRTESCNDTDEAIVAIGVRRETGREIITVFFVPGPIYLLFFPGGEPVRTLRQYHLEACSFAGDPRLPD